MSQTLRGADIVARSLKRLGCRRVFTLSGNHIMSIFDAALDADLDLVHVRHEAAAVHMADAYGRLTGEPGIALVTGGPGHANAVGALFTALGAESPMVLLSGHAATWELGRGGFQEIRQADMAAPVTKASWTATAAATLGRDIGEAIRIATSGRPGPVHLSLPSDLLDAAGRRERRASGRSRAAPAPPALTEAAADTILAAIAGARAPDHPRRPAAVHCERPRAARQARSRDRRAGRHHGKPARHRRRHARRLPRSDGARRPDRAARQGARLHHQMGGRPGVRSGRAADRRSIPTRRWSSAPRRKRAGGCVLGCVADARRRGRSADRARRNAEAAQRRLARRGARRARQPTRRVGERSSRRRQAGCIPPRCSARCAPSSSAIPTPF